MKYYKYDSNSNRYNAFDLPTQHCNVVELCDRQTPLKPRWKQIRLLGFDDNPGPDGDFPTLNDFSEIPLFSERAWGILKPLIDNCVEPLPIISPGGLPFFLIHVMKTNDCLDVAKSEVRRSDVDGRISQVFRYAFKNELLKGKHIIRLPIESGGDLLVSDEFRKTCQRERLMGLTFKPLPMVNS